MTVPSNPRSCARGERGVTLVETMIALVILAIGVLAVSQMFPLGSRSQTANQQFSSANYLAQQEIERLNGLAWTDPDLIVGSHPVSTLDHGYQRTWTVSNLDYPLDSVKRIDVTVTWRQGTKTYTATTYMRR